MKQKSQKKWVYDVPGILNNTFSVIQDHEGKALTEHQLLQMIDDVYSDIEIESDPHFKDGMKKYIEIQRNLHFIKDNVNKDEVYTREGLDTISVIPMINHANKYGEKEVYWSSEFKDKSTMEKQSMNCQCEGQKKFSYLIEKDDSGFSYIDAYYTYETGLTFPVYDKSAFF